MAYSSVISGVPEVVIGISDPRLVCNLLARCTMEVDWFENLDAAEEMLQVDADNDASMFEDDVCGLCRLIIIDRGVLDCCQHWFCFQCIDDWSTITNLCPLCHNEFQLITCVPVIDTIGGSTTDEDSISRNNDWSVEGKNSTLSFPSYYIDENSVTCLDGDGCKLGSESVSLDENLAFDTSIACDSCDTWVDFAQTLLCLLVVNGVLKNGLGYMTAEVVPQL